MINYIEHNSVDKERYDRCIGNASNGIIYAFSWYLDSVAPGWDLIEYNNYSAVMPLPKRKRFGISYIFTPRYVQQLGIFGNNITIELNKKLIEQLPGKFKLLELKFNEGNTADGSNIWKERVNYVLNIEDDYNVNRKKYHRNCSRNIKKASKAGLSVGEAISSVTFAQFVAENLREQIDGFVDKDVKLLAKITEESISRGKGEIIGVFDKEGKISAAGSFLFSANRLIFSVCASSPEGHKNQAMYYLVDHQIKQYSGKFSHFDFSGSELKGIAYFNSTFGAEAVSYPLLHINKLPLPLKLLTGKW